VVWYDPGLMSRLWLFEDAAARVQAAKQAGLWVVAVENGGYGGDLSEAHEVIGSFREGSFEGS
jgi:beta-phosphoglucomutase-like phosphatase (HAD superfamily)